MYSRTNTLPPSLTPVQNTNMTTAMVNLHCQFEIENHHGNTPCEGAAIKVLTEQSKPNLSVGGTTPWAEAPDWIKMRK